MSLLGLVLLGYSVAAAAGPLPVPFIRQQENGCGAASVAMVIQYWERRDVASQVYGQLYDAGRKGILLADMRDYFEESGYRAYTLRGGWDDVVRHIDRGRPLIVALRPGARKPMHFAVITGAEPGFVWLNDPTRSKARRLKRADFERQWSLADRWLLLAARPPS